MPVTSSVNRSRRWSGHDLMKENGPELVFFSIEGNGTAAGGSSACEITCSFQEKSRKFLKDP